VFGAGLLVGASLGWLGGRGGAPPTAAGDAARSGETAPSTGAAERTATALPQGGIEARESSDSNDSRRTRPSLRAPSFAPNLELLEAELAASQQREQEPDEIVGPESGEHTGEVVHEWIHKLEKLDVTQEAFDAAVAGLGEDLVADVDCSDAPCVAKLRNPGPCPGGSGNHVEALRAALGDGWSVEGHGGVSDGQCLSAVEVVSAETAERRDGVYAGMEAYVNSLWGSRDTRQEALAP